MKDNKDSLLILHGWQSSREMWESVKKDLEERGVNVVLPDIPGFKSDTKLKKEWDLDDYVSWASSLILESQRMGKLGKSFYILGHSFGGRISIKLSSQNPEFLKGIILVSAAGVKRDKLYKKILEKGAKLMKKVGFKEGNKLGDILRNIFYKYILRRTDYFNTSGYLRSTIKNILEEDLTHLLSRIKVPSLIIWGEHDKVTPLEDAEVMRKNILNSKLKILKNTGHTPHLESRRELVETIASFIKHS